MLADAFSPLLIEVVRDSGHGTQLGQEVGWSLAGIGEFPSSDFVLDDKERLTFLFDVEVVSPEVVLLEVGDIVADEDIHHGFELDVEDSVECWFSVGGHDDCVNEGFFDLVSLFLLIFA